MVKALKNYIVETKQKSGSSNKLCYCKACFIKLGENSNELKTIVDKTERSNSTSSQSSNYGPLDNFVARPLSKADNEVFHKLILKATISCGFPLSWVNNQETTELFKFLNPHIKLPDRKTLSTKLLNDAVKEYDNVMLEKLRLDQIGVTLMFDGWTNVRQQELMGCVLLMSDGEPCVWQAMDISSERDTMFEVMTKTEELISKLIDMKITLLSIVTDSAPSYNASRQFKNTSGNALKVSAYFKDARHKYFIGQLRDIQKELYSKYIQLALPCNTRWNSQHNCFKSLIATKNALRSLAIKFDPSSSTNTLKISHEIDKARLYEVLHCYAYLYQFWKSYSDELLASRILSRLENRWSLWEQPLLILSWLLHPFENNIHKYWCWVQDAYPEIGIVAAHIFGICINAASVERLWSSMGFFHSKNRNRLEFTRVLEMAKLKAGITYNRLLQQELSLSNKEINLEEQNSIEREMILEAESSNVNTNLNEESYLGGQNDEQDNNSLEADVIAQFNNNLGEWIEILQEEENESLNELINIEDDEFYNLDVQSIDHPATSSDGKWKLEVILKNDIHCPF
ncbi:16110_t:CDS:2 [Entrophospora sp. SA101]|nr:16110_t:CDS:2 [Entrophospora sp. SA101]